MAERRDFTVVDWVFLGLVALPELFALVFPVLVAPVYARIFADFGSSLPLLTQLVVTRWFGFVVGMPAFLPLALALDGRRGLGERRVLLLVGLVLALAGAGTLIWGVYAPMFAMAEGLR